MNFTYCNVTADEGDVHAEEPLAIGITFHTLGVLLCIIFGGIAVVLSVFLMFMHATHYSEPLEQRYILRILFMVPIYAIVSFLSFAFWRYSVYLDVLRDCYEAFAISSFFALMCHYVAPTLHEQKEVFRQITPKKWIWPAKWGRFEFFRTPRSGLTWFNVIWFCIYQYCIVRVACTILALVTQALGRYCLSSESPLFAHVWVTVIEATAVTIAMFCLIQFYVQLKDQLAPYKPGWKLVAIKAVIFLSFWQTFVLSILTSSTANVVHAGKHVAQPDLVIGIPSLCICIEMSLFAVMHIFVYPWKPYSINSEVGMQVANQTGAKRDRYHGGFLGIKAFLDAYNPIDIFRAVGRGFRWIFVGRKRRFNDPSYKNQGIAADGTTLEEVGKTGRAGFTIGKQSKYSQLGGDDDADDIPLTSQGAAHGTSHEPRYPQNPFDDRLDEPTSYKPEHPASFDDFAPPQRRPSRPFSPYESYRATRQGKHQQTQSSGDLADMPSNSQGPPLPSQNYFPNEGVFQPAPLHPGAVPPILAPGGSSSHPYRTYQQNTSDQHMQDNPWTQGRPL